jgi:hypothetical protein
VADQERDRPIPATSGRRAIPSVEAQPGPRRTMQVLEDILPNRLDLRGPHVLGILFLGQFIQLEPYLGVHRRTGLGLLAQLEDQEFSPKFLKY